MGISRSGRINLPSPQIPGADAAPAHPPQQLFAPIIPPPLPQPVQTPEERLNMLRGVFRQLVAEQNFGVQQAALNGRLVRYDAVVANGQVHPNFLAQTIALLQQFVFQNLPNM